MTLCEKYKHYKYDLHQLIAFKEQVKDECINKLLSRLVECNIKEQDLYLQKESETENQYKQRLINRLTKHYDFLIEKL